MRSGCRRGSGLPPSTRPLPHEPAATGTSVPTTRRGVALTPWCPSRRPRRRSLCRCRISSLAGALGCVSSPGKMAPPPAGTSWPRANGGWQRRGVGSPSQRVAEKKRDWQNIPLQQISGTHHPQRQSASLWHLVASYDLGALATAGYRQLPTNKGVPHSGHTTAPYLPMQRPFWLAR